MGMRRHNCVPRLVRERELSLKHNGSALNEKELLMQSSGDPWGQHPQAPRAPFANDAAA